MGHRYTPEQIVWLRESAPGTSFAQLTEQFNQRFGDSRTHSSIRSACRSRGIKNGLWRKYTKEHLDFIRDNIAGVPLRDFRIMFNEHFGLNLQEVQIHHIVYTNGFGNGRDNKGARNSPATEFKKGQVPFNKGRKGIHMSPATEFQKGNVPKNRKPIGSERICTDGYTWVKTKESKTWKEKHRLIWEETHGPIPNGYCVIFADNDRTNIVLENLLLVSRRQLVIMNQRRLITNNAELTKAGVATALLIIKANDKLTVRQKRKIYNKTAREKAKESESRG